MPLAFNFFSSKRSSVATPAAVTSVASPALGAGVQGVNVSTLPEEPASAPAPQNHFPARSASEPMMSPVQSEVVPGQDWGSAPTLLLPGAQGALEDVAGAVLPERRVQQRGLAALAVHQSEKEAPPLNRRPVTSPFPAATPDLGVASVVSSEAPISSSLAAAVPAPSQSVPTGASRPPSGPFQPIQDIMRQDLQEEIEQVKNDLFGAVMGVSALKDRLDGLEAQLSRAPAPASHAAAAPVTWRPEIESWVTTWMETHLPMALERALTASQERMIASLSPLGFFRATAPLSGSERQSFLAQPPVILTATPV